MVKAFFFGFQIGFLHILNGLAYYSLSWLNGIITLKLVLVMVVIPVILNSGVVIVVDTFIKK